MYDNNGNIVKRREFAFTLKDATLIEELESTDLAPETVNGLNLYAYCGNNPVMGIDPNGNAWWNPFSWAWSAIEKTIDQVSQTISNTISSVAKNLQNAYVTVTL